MTPVVPYFNTGITLFHAEPKRSAAIQKARPMPDPPENLSRPETNLTPADAEPAGAAIPADFAKRLERFEAETRRREKSFLKRRFVFGLSVLIGLCYLPLLITYTPLIGPKLLLFIFALCFTGLISVVLFRRYARPSTATIHLIQESDTPTIALLLKRLDIFPSAQEERLIRQAIREQLKHISPDEANALPPYIRDRLNWRLASAIHAEGYTAENVEFCLVWLKVLEQIGSASDLRSVESLAETRAKSPLHKAVRDAARECLPHVEARIQAQNTSKTLLRASTSPPIAPETLLRPAAKSNPTAPNELLRPAENEEEI